MVSARGRRDPFPASIYSTLSRIARIFWNSTAGTNRLDEISPEVVKTLRDFAPFGPKNMRPNFASYGLEIVGMPRIVGSNHLKFKVRQPSSGGLVFDAIGFNLGHLLPILQNGPGVDMVYTIEENKWMNQINLQLCAKDLR